VWVIWPEKRKAWEYSTHPSSFELKEITDVLTVFGMEVEIKLADMWAGLDRRNSSKGF
jgi:hypothetical protein